MAIIRSPQFPQYHSETFVKGPGFTKAIEWSLDARRLNIFFRRSNVMHDAIERGEKPVINIIGSTDSNTSEHSIIDPVRENLENKKDNLRFGESNDNSLTHQNMPGARGSALQDYVSIIDIDVGGYNKGHEEIKLPFIPRELNYNSESAFTAIKPIGANNPRYQFTGAEDKLEFEIDWYSFDENREDVIRQCRKIEALTKADSYNGNPHRVYLKWGQADRLFATHTFIVIAAPYRMTRFSKGHVSASRELVITDMLPVQAYQKITLARISRKNLSKVEIEYVEEQISTRI